MERDREDTLGPQTYRLAEDADKYLERDLAGSPSTSQKLAPEASGAYKSMYVQSLEDSNRLLHREVESLRERQRENEEIRQDRDQLEGEVLKMRSLLAQARSVLASEVVAESKLKVEEQIVDALRQSLEEETRNRAQLHEQKQYLEDEIAALQKRIEADHDDRQRLEKAKDKLKDEVAELQQLLVTAVNRSERAYHSNKSAESELETLKSTEHSLRERLMSSEVQLKAEKEDRQMLERLRQKLEAEVVSLTQQLVQLSQDAAGKYSSQRNSEEHEWRRLMEKASLVDPLEAEVKALQREKRRLELEVDTLKDMLVAQAHGESEVFSREKIQRHLQNASRKLSGISTQDVDTVSDRLSFLNSVRQVPKTSPAFRDASPRSPSNGGDPHAVIGQLEGLKADVDRELERLSTSPNASRKLEF